VGLIQRELERRGIPTVSVTINRTLTEAVRPPRALFLRWPFGHPFGDPGAREQQMTVLKETLRALLTMTEPGTLVDLPYKWRRQVYAGLPESIRLDATPR
jgi:D-proline reductase (dithiol) PrdB